MFTPRKDSLPSPSLEDSFFPLSSSSAVSLSFALQSTSSSQSGGDEGGAMETDLILAAELGQALLEKNEELAETLQQREKEVEALQQEKHVLQRKLEMNELESGQKESELTADLAALRAELEKYHSEGRDRRKDDSEQMAQLANHNQRLVEQLAEAVTLEHSLRTELRALREEMEESSFSRSISLTQLENMQTENKVLQERLSHLETRLKASEDDSQRLRAERDGLRDRISELQVKLSEKEAEATEALLAHSSVLQAKDEEIQALKEELQSHQKELGSLRDEIKLCRGSLEKPSYSSLESELAKVHQEKDLLTQQLLNTIKQKVKLTQELDAWQEDMRFVINQQVLQREEEKKKEDKQEKENTFGLQRSKSLRVRGEGGKGFFSSLFKDK
ncbi:BICD family-like cargo adapter 2 isoform X3 [Cyprinodon tularosa]|uniref:bicaudal D-related protein 2-like isoform X2 n=1 Tax=Cyprinodon variegatus TaxID=28743 RepID=UPI0007427F8A|nr:PREDICTED: bicaudal D-related protein 2-like isoform X2 [Cyprinodon variegatus]XP_038129919.1 BICD family-like cargo adapter 2 isoform X3 [Cyprinodon tularosa]